MAYVRPLALDIIELSIWSFSLMHWIKATQRVSKMTPSSLVEFGCCLGTHKKDTQKNCSEEVTRHDNGTYYVTMTYITSSQWTGKLLSSNIELQLIAQGSKTRSVSFQKQCFVCLCFETRTMLSSFHCKFSETSITWRHWYVCSGGQQEAWHLAPDC